MSTRVIFTDIYEIFHELFQALRPDDKFRHGSMINWISKVTSDTAGGDWPLNDPRPLSRVPASRVEYSELSLIDQDIRVQIKLARGSRESELQIS